MKILFVSYHFAPQNVVGAVRPTKVAKKLVENGHIVDVVTSYSEETEGLPIPFGINKIHYIKKTEYEKRVLSIPSGFAKKKKKDGFIENQTSTTDISQSKKNWRSEIKRSILYWFRLFEFRRFAKHFKKHFKKDISSKYDIIYTSFGPLPSIFCGFYAKKKNKKIIWVSEFRDPIMIEDLPFIYRKKLLKIQNKACKKADKIVAVSNGYLKRICGDKYKHKAYMIPNGYDEEDFIAMSNNQRNEKLTISYVGALYEGKRDLSPIFKAIAELIRENKVDKHKICFQYAGGETDVILKQATVYDMQDIVKSVGKIPRKECLELQFTSDMLVLSTWNNKGEEGVFPGKFLEYMLIRKPIIAVVDGNIGDSEVKQVMEEGAFGVTYESVYKERDFVALKAYIEKQYNHFTVGEALAFCPNEEVLQRYNYKTIIKQIEELIN